MAKEIDYFNATVKPEIMHLFLLKTCRHKCPMCCNNLYNIDEIPVPTIKELKTVHTVCFTGGEPFLVEDLYKIAVKLKKQYPNIERIYSYTSGLSFLMYLKKYSDKNVNCLEGIDGVTISPKDKLDWSAANTIMGNSEYRTQLNLLKSNRLYVFTDDDKSYTDEIKANLEKSNFRMIERYWDDEFETPENEIFRRLPILMDK